jgi:hypothetical protein
VTSLTEKQVGAQRLLRLGRGHGSIENKNHYRRDANRWQEDRHRFRVNRDSAFNLSLLMGAVMTVMEPAEGVQNQIFEKCCQSKAFALKLLNSKASTHD